MQTYVPGTHIGQYEIASRPMMGGMGVVYFALDHGNDGRPVALKTFRPELLPDRAARDRFLREGTAWIELGSHPHIVRCYKVEYIDPTAFLILELIAKEQNMPDASLRSWLIPGHPLPLEQALLFALQIARGMQHATEKIPGFVHRDLKPENILVGADRLPNTNINHLRVTDFGLVKTISDSSSPTTTDKAGELKPNQVQFTRGVGTPLYMAPEQWKGEQVGVFTDVYAFGCILFEMLVGQYIAQGQTITELQVSHCGGMLRTVPSNLSKDVNVFLAKCFALKPSERYGYWHEIIDAIENIYSNLGGVSAPLLTEEKEFTHDERIQIGWSYNTIGVAYLDIGKSEAAVGYFEKAFIITHEIGDWRGKSLALGNLGLAYTDLGDIKQAIKFYEQALVIDREIGDRYAEGAVLGSLATAYLNLGDARQAVKYYEQRIEIARQIGDRRGEGKALGNLGIAYKNLGDTRRAIKYYEQYLVIAREVGDQRGVGNALGNIGSIYLILGDVQRASTYYEEQLVIMREIGDRRSEGAALGNLGNMYLESGNLYQAVENYKQALVIDREVGDGRGESSDLSNLGSAYAQLGDTQQAISCFEQCLPIIQKIGDRHIEGTVLGNLGSAYLKINDIYKAIKYYENALVINHEIGDLSGIAFVSFNIALLYSRQGESARALPLAQKASEIFLQIGSPNAKRAQELIAKLRQLVNK